MKFSKVYDTLQNLTYGNVSQAELGRALGVSRSNINYKKDNDVELSEEDVKKIETYFEVQILKSDEFVSIPVLGSVEASMGFGVTIYNESQTAIYEISRKLARDLGISEAFTKMIFARGNSMSPTIESGDNLLVDMSKTDVYDGKIYCIRKDGQLYAKRLQKLSASQLKIISDNKDYEPIIIDFSKNTDLDFAILGEVRWAGRVFV